MAILTYTEQGLIEKFLKMGNGYVMNFSNSTFQKFIEQSVGLDINNEKYYNASNSKANRLRKFIEVESNYTFGQLLESFCNYWFSKVKTKEIDPGNDEYLFDECLKIAERLKKENAVDDLGVLQFNIDDDRNVKMIKEEIKRLLEENKPEVALDRLHTLTFRILRELCNNHDISYEDNNSLNAIYGKYKKFLDGKNYIESNMAKVIMKYSINVIEAFNDIRNNKSLAHDNTILNYEESILILNNIFNTIKFIQTIENKIKSIKDLEQLDSIDLPF